MTTLTVDRLHVRYDNVDAQGASLLDDALADLTDASLDIALIESDLSNAMSVAEAAWAVCIRSVQVDVVVSASDSRRVIGDTWSRAIIDGVRRTIESQATDDLVVVYRTESDALLDVFAASAVGDSQRRWAWRQAGLVPMSCDRVGSDDLAMMLAKRPALAPAVLRSSGAAGKAALDADGWISVARAVAPVVAGSWTSDDDPATAAPMAAVGALSAELVAVAAFVPEEAWRTATPADRSRLGVLALTALRPHLSRCADAIRRVVHHQTALRTRDLDRSPDEAATRISSEAPRRRPEADTHNDTHNDTDVGDDPAAPSLPATELTSEWGGVWFLVRAIAELQLFESLGDDEIDATAALAVLVSKISGAPPDDASLRLLCGLGLGLDLGDEVQSDSSTSISNLCESVGNWLAARDLVDDAQPGGSLWRRRVTIRVAPGSIDVSFSLDDVEIPVRRAGLDLDPGFVWWTGAVVRFRYV